MTEAAPQADRAIVNLLWNRLHHGAWERHRVTRTIGKTDPGNPYTPRPAVGRIPRPDAADLVDELHTEARILGAIYPSEVPGLPAPLAVELRVERWDVFLAELRVDDRAALLAAIEAWPHAYAVGKNRHGRARFRLAADAHAVRVAHGLVGVATVRPFDEGEIEPAFICEGDLAELERAAWEALAARV